MLIKAPQHFHSGNPSVFKIFLAGSIESDMAVSWQDRIGNEFAKKENVWILNPAREDWDENWHEEIDDPQFNEQLNWESNALEQADLIVMYFAADSQAPITLLELGLFAASGKLLVCCSAGFWKKGNVDFVCQKYGVQQFISIEELIKEVHQKYTQWQL